MKIFLSTVILSTCLTLNNYSQTPADKFRQTEVPLEERIEDLLRRLTLEEKVKLCYGNVTNSTPDRFNSGGIERFNIKQIEMLDGPVGVRDFDAARKTTALPSTLLLSCTWDINAAKRYGEVIAAEMLGLGKHVIFGPGINLMRSPLGGRNFEYMGEDPFLAGKMAAGYIKGIQAMGVAANAKHYVANETDNLRHFTSSNLDERTLHEIYLLPFEMAIKEGKVWTLMTGNNLVNGIHVSENKQILNDVLRDQFNFDGVVLTDWRAAYNTAGSALAGTDMTTGFCAYVFGEDRLLNAVKNGEVPEKLIDEKVRRILRLYFRTGVIDTDKRLPGSVNTPEFRDQARKLASEGMVLLKNTGNILPVKSGVTKNIFVTGPGAAIVPSGTGSSKVDPESTVTPVDGLKSGLKDCNINFIKYDASKVDLLLTEARSSDMVIFFATGSQSGESSDLKDMELPNNQANVINELAKVNNRIVVITLSGGVVSLESWSGNVAAILSCLYSGQSTGDAICDVLSGRANPGGKLSYTIAKKIDDYACHTLGLWPQKRHDGNTASTVQRSGADRRAVYGYDSDYGEGLFMGYRWFEQKKIEPLFPFGHGLSYTSFSIKKSKVRIVSGKANDPEVKVEVNIRNIGDRAGSEVIQLYLGEVNSSVPRPFKELKGFQKIYLEAGSKNKVVIDLDFRSFAYWNEKTSEWKADAGEYVIYVGNSSANIAFTQKIVLK